MSEEDKPADRYSEIPIQSEAAVTAEMEPAAHRNESGQFTVGNTASKGKRLKLAKNMLVGANDTNPMYAKFLRQGRKWASSRRDEFADTYGDITGGVGMLIENAGYMLALSRYFDYLAREVADQIVTGTELFKKAVSFIQEHRQLELQAHNIATGEAKARKTRYKNSPHAVLTLTPVKKLPEAP